MIINREYIIERYAYLMLGQQSRLESDQHEVNKILKIKYGIPKWLRKIIFNPWNPFFSIIKQRKVNKQENNSIKVHFGNSVAIEFIMQTLFYDNVYSMDTSLFFDTSQDDEEIVRFIDYRIKSVFAGFDRVPMTDIQRADKKMIDELREKVKKYDALFFTLKLPERKYFLPGKFFTHYVFFKHYGLKDLPVSLISYIKDKDFLDVGAFCGDSSLMFLQYEPHFIYAYEPVKNNYELLSKTIERNNVQGKILAINKGLGDQVAYMNINVDGDASSVNSTMQKGDNIEQVEISTIDLDCKDKTIGLIKMDVEGFEYYVIKGGLETIKRDKPILLISIYHTAKDFFEIPPMITSICSEYKFKFVNLVPSDLLAEKILIAYVVP